MWIAIIAIVVGCGLLIWRRQFAAGVVRDQNRMWGFRFGEREERVSVFVTTLVGLGFLTIGILTALWFIHFK